MQDRRYDPVKYSTSEMARCESDCPHALPHHRHHHLQLKKKKQIKERVGKKEKKDWSVVHLCRPSILCMYSKE